MAYIKQIYTAFIRVSGLKLWSLGDCNIVLFCFGAAPLSKIAQLQSPRAHSFNQSLSWPYIFVYYKPTKLFSYEFITIGSKLISKTK